MYLKNRICVWSYFQTASVNPHSKRGGDGNTVRLWATHKKTKKKPPRNLLSCGVLNQPPSCNHGRFKNESLLISINVQFCRAGFDEEGCFLLVNQKCYLSPELFSVDLRKCERRKWSALICLFLILNLDSWVYTPPPLNILLSTADMWDTVHVKWRLEPQPIQINV